MRDLFNSLISSILVTMIVIMGINVTAAQVRSSSNYQLQQDSVNIGGGFSTSTSYNLESTVGEVGTGNASSSNYNLYAGYQQLDEVTISLSVSGDVLMLPNIYGVTGGTSNGSTTVTVTTDSPTGYQLDLVAEGAPAMQSAVGNINDYNPATSDPDFSFTTGGSDAHFGYSPEGVDIVDRFLDDGGDCNTGSTDTSLSCWDGLSTTDETIAEGSGPNNPSGADTTINFRVGVGSGAGLTAGDYQATSTVTALPL